MTRAVVFDIGGVLIDWRPHLAWRDELTEVQTRAFMERVDFTARNGRADAGEQFHDLAAELDDPGDARLLAAYVERYPLTVQDTVPGTWELLDRLREGGTTLHAITNWSAETWPHGLTVHPRLQDVFATTIVSGIEKLSKPDPAIFRLFCDRAALSPEDCLFIDDSAPNVAGARSIGMDAVHFTVASALEKALIERGLLS